MKKRYILIAGIIILLVVVRILMPHIVKNYVNRVLQEQEGYTGSVYDIDLHLYRGSYVIDSLNIQKEDSTSAIPFFSADRIDLSIEWNALFDGSIVSEILLFKPELNFIDASDSTESQYGEGVDWTEPIKDLIPFRINRFTVEDGKIHFRNFESTPEIDLYVDDFYLELTNVTNSTDIEDSLPSTINVRASSIGNGKLDISGKMNLIKEIPDMDIDLKFEDVDMTSLNDFLKVYSGLDVEKGNFNLYSEFLIDNGSLEGYIKPLIRDMRVIDWNEEKEGFFKKVWESIAGFVLEIFENQEKDQFATRIPLEGDLDSPDTAIFPAIWNIFYNAFIEAFKMETDNIIQAEKNEE
jgi:hypothetical protein